MFLYGELLKSFLFFFNSYNKLICIFSRFVRDYGVQLDLVKKTVAVHNTCRGQKEHSAGIVKIGVNKENVYQKIEKH